MATLQSMFEEHAAATMDKEACLAEFTKSIRYDLNLEAGTITYRLPKSRLGWLAQLTGGRLGVRAQVFPVQILGTESYVSNTWQWAWGNCESNFPPRLLQAALKMRDYGSTHEIRELTEPELELVGSFCASASGNVTIGHYLSLIATGFCQADAYFRAPYHNGAAYLLIMAAPPVRERAKNYVTAGFMDLIREFPCDHRQAFLGYMRSKGLACTWNGRELHCVSDELLLLADFDEQDMFRGASVKRGPCLDPGMTFAELRRDMHEAQQGAQPQPPMGDLRTASARIIQETPSEYAELPAQEGTWYLRSKQDPRWNCSAPGHSQGSMLMPPVMPPETREAVAKLRESIGAAPPPDFRWIFVAKKAAPAKCVHCGGSGWCFCLRKGTGNPVSCPRCNGSGRCRVCAGLGEVKRIC
jgi:hypothetical protein